MKQICGRDPRMGAVRGGGVEHMLGRRRARSQQYSGRKRWSRRAGARDPQGAQRAVLRRGGGSAFGIRRTVVAPGAHAVLVRTVALGGCRHVAGVERAGKANGCPNALGQRQNHRRERHDTSGDTKTTAHRVQSRLRATCGQALTLVIPAGAPLVPARCSHPAQEPGRENPGGDGRERATSSLFSPWVPLSTGALTLSP